LFKQSGDSLDDGAVRLSGITGDLQQLELAPVFVKANNVGKGPTNIHPDPQRHEPFLLPITLTSPNYNFEANVL